MSEDKKSKAGQFFLLVYLTAIYKIAREKRYADGFKDSDSEESKER